MVLTASVRSVRPSAVNLVVSLLIAGLRRLSGQAFSCLSGERQRVRDYSRNAHEKCECVGHLLLCAADAGIIPSMKHTWALIGLLVALCLIGATTTQLTPAATEAGRIGWMLYLIACPLALAALIWIGWTWTAMACVIYGTVGLALDLATVTSILTGQAEIGALFLFSAMSGIVNFLLILFGGRAFFHSSLGTALPESRPPSPPSPSSSARP